MFKAVERSIFTRKLIEVQHLKFVVFFNWFFSCRSEMELNFGDGSTTHLRCVSLLVIGTMDKKRNSQNTLETSGLFWWECLV